ncbi:hypothetical protein [Deinococcus ruber]|uniref:Uncharacterized protein n=1 Tax=Deinococcus ruber TaxID=1848197 RepID=A0A918C4Z7_9DEIO|nr:hypothetical protein [Deinococcus ruber]GGR05978.1 hypothetical protein GCM10008957_18420 [Deinococcus ruber]
MDDLISLTLQLCIGLLASPFIAGLLCGLTALYGVGSEWPAWSCIVLALGWVSLWVFALWRLRS